MSDLAALIDAVPYYRYLGLRAGTHGTVVMPGDDRHASDGPQLHGGVLAAFLEAAAVLHLRDSGAPGARTGDLTATFLRPAGLVDTTAQVRAIRRGRRFAQLEITAWQSDPAAPVAVGLGTWILRP
jgi:uncharacterized protein (TIGR00369 family)